MVNCPECGSDNPENVSFCGRCGTQIPYSLRMAKEQEATAKKCGSCGESNAPRANYCSNCGWSLLGQWAPKAAVTVRKKRQSRVPIAGGVLSMVAGALGVVQGMLLLTAASVAEDIGLHGSGVFVFSGGVALLLGIGGLAGGVFAVQHKKFWFALIGAVMGMWVMGFGVGFILGLIGLIMIAISKEEF